MPKLVSFVEITNISTYSRKTSKLRNVYTIDRGAENISIKKCEINYLKNQKKKNPVVYLKY